MMFVDKRRAVINASKSGRGRIPEKTLLWTSLLMGFVGIGAGMILFRHKTRKMNFKIGIPLTGVINVALYEFLKARLAENFGWHFYFDSSVIDFLVG